MILICRGTIAWWILLGLFVGLFGIVYVHTVGVGYAIVEHINGTYDFVISKYFKKLEIF